MRIVSRYAFAQRRQSRLQRITILLLLDYAHRLAHNHIRRRQIRLPEPETDTARLRPIRNLSDHALLDSAEKSRRLELFLFDKLELGVLCCLKLFQFNPFTLGDTREATALSTLPPRQ